MKKYFVVTDVHSYFTLMKDALEQAGYDKANPNHIFVSCGDLLDRGDESAAILTFVNSIPKSRKILIGVKELLINHSCCYFIFELLIIIILYIIIEYIIIQ